MGVVWQLSLAYKLKFLSVGFLVRYMKFAPMKISHYTVYSHETCTSWWINLSGVLGVPFGLELILESTDNGLNGTTLSGSRTNLKKNVALAHFSML